MHLATRPRLRVREDVYELHRRPVLEHSCSHDARAYRLERIILLDEGGSARLCGKGLFFTRKRENFDYGFRYEILIASKFPPPGATQHAKLMKTALKLAQKSEKQKVTYSLPDPI